MNTDCTVRRKAVTISLGEYMAVYRDEQKFMEYCRQCPNYARLWSCPPFDDCKDRIFRDYSQITIFASIITPDSNDIPLVTIIRNNHPRTQTSGTYTAGDGIQIHWLCVCICRLMP